MKRYFLFVVLAIGLLASNVAIAKGHESRNVSVSEEVGNSSGFDSLYSYIGYIHIAVANGEVIKEYADEVIEPVKPGYKDEIFHPPASRNII